jgi:hypothetical protein
MLHWPLLVALLAAEPARPFTSPKSTAAEYGHGLSIDSARDGWISLFDGRTTFGWNDAEAADKQIRGGTTTSDFSDLEIEADVVSAGKLVVGKKSIELAVGQHRLKLLGEAHGPLRLEGNLAVRRLVVRPAELSSLFSGEDHDGWKPVVRAGTPPEKQTRWRVENRALRAQGGPGALELQRLYADFVLQIDVRTRGRLVNGGVFFRTQPGSFMNGYESQVFNACYDEDSAQPARYSTGSIDDRQVGRRLVSRDLEPFTMTVIAVGPHVAIWINGFQTADWTDTRKEDDNPRNGLRVAAGTIQLQAHDPETDLQFSNIRAIELK